MMQILGVVVGLVLVYLVLSLVCTSVNELIAGMVNSRAKGLTGGLTDLLAHQQKEATATEAAEGKPATPARKGFDLLKAFREHPFFKNLQRPYQAHLWWEAGRKDPSYLPGGTFASIVIDVLDRNCGSSTHDMASVKKAVAGLAESDVSRALQALAAEAGDDLQAFRKQLEGWFNGAMQRVGEWYRRKTQVVLLGIAFVVCTVANADTFRIVKTLSNDSAVRDALVAQAKVFAEKPAPRDAVVPNAKAAEGAPRGVPEAEDSLTQNIRDLQGLGLPMGWQEFPSGLPAILSLIVGLLVSAFAVSLGAPFWFDMLNRVINIRAAATHPDEKEKGAKKEK